MTENVRFTGNEVGSSGLVSPGDEGLDRMMGVVVEVGVGPDDGGGGQSWCGTG